MINCISEILFTHELGITKAKLGVEAVGNIVKDLVQQKNTVRIFSIVHCNTHTLMKHDSKIPSL